MNPIFLVVQFFCIAVVLLFFCLPAEAYIHFTYGSLVTQFMLSGFLGLLIASRQSFFDLLLRTFKRTNCFVKNKAKF
jgi:hypothetical protein